MPIAAISAEEVNYLVYRYLIESGFTHSAFTFHNESGPQAHEIYDKRFSIPAGALITYLQKGLEYIHLEKNVADVSNRGEGPLHY